MDISFFYKLSKLASGSQLEKESQLGVVHPMLTRGGNIERELPHAYQPRKSRPDIFNPDRDYLTDLLLNEFNKNVTQSPSDENYANELINP